MVDTQSLAISHSHKDYRSGDPVPKLGPFAKRLLNMDGSHGLMSQRISNTTSRRPFMAEIPGHQTRQDRLRVPHYQKPIQMELLEERSEASSTASGIVQTIKTRVSNFLTRIVGGNQDEKSTNEPQKRKTVLVSDVRRDIIDDDHYHGQKNIMQEGEGEFYDDDRALERVNPSYLNIGKVDSINYFSGKSSNAGGARFNQARAPNANESMESVTKLSSSRRILRAPSNPGVSSARFSRLSSQPRVEQSRFVMGDNYSMMSPRGIPQNGLKRTYLDLKNVGRDQ